MKAIFIDAENKTVTDVEVPEKGTLQAWYKILKCDMVEIAMYINEHEDSILVDEEGLLKDLKPDSPFFFFTGAPQPYAGNGLITGTDNEGESISPHITADEIRDKVVFMTASTAWYHLGTS